MPEQAPDYWTPDLSPKQAIVFNMPVTAKNEHPHSPVALLVSGARWTGKTIGTINLVLRHLWETPGARFGLLSKTIHSATDAGVFRDMVEVEAPKWINSGIGFEFKSINSDGIPGPKQDSKTRTIHFHVANRFGGISELQLLSLNHDHEVYAKFKNTRWSGIWVSELALFKDPKVFTTIMMQLRMMHLKPWQHLFVGDTNPAEEGEEHWAYKLWFQHKYEDEEDEKDIGAQEFKKSLRLIEFFLEDNPWLSDGELRRIRNLYKNDPGEKAREVDGLWVKGHGNRGKHFADLYAPHLHVVGGTDDEGDQIDLLPTTTTLFSGWDIGAGVNHAALALERRMYNVGGMDWSVWCVLDELVYIAEQIQVRDFAIQFLALVKAIEARAKKRFSWTHWSDDTALNVFRNSGAGLDALEVQLATKGEIILQGVTKPEGSVRNRVKILRRLLKENRIFISSRCKAVQEMLKECSQGTTQKEYVAWNKHKHVFDALTYPILIESGYELLDEVWRPTASAVKKYAGI